METEFHSSNPNIHTSRDGVDGVDVTWMAEFARVGVGMAGELGGGLIIDIFKLSLLAMQVARVSSIIITMTHMPWDSLTQASDRLRQPSGSLRAPVYASDA
jgi:hypothetical protein